MIGYRWTLSYFLQNYAIVHLNSRKLTKRCRSVQLAIDGKGLSKDSASVIILFAQKAKYCGGCQRKSVWLFVHFLNTLCWPTLASFLDPQSGQHILDIACGNGLTSLRLAALGAQVTAFDFSANLIEKAKARENPGSRITYHVIDATNEQQLLSLGEQAFDSALSNMALFDMADIETLFRTLPKLLKPNGNFVFSLTHPAFNNAASMHVAEEMDFEGEIKTVYSVKISRYMTPYRAKGLALRSQPKPQMYFERPLRSYLNLGFQNGFVLDGFEERAFPPESSQTFPLGWGGNFSEIPPALIARFRKL